MTRTLTLAAAALSSLWLSCGPLPAATSVAVADDDATLTAAGDDLLFALTLAEAEAPLPLAEVNVYAGLPGQTATVVNFTHRDANGDGKLDIGEALVTREPGVNLFDSATVGKTLSVGFSRKGSSGVWSTLATASWTPAQ